MTASIKQYYENVDAFALDSDKPCDTASVWTIVDNVQHLVESSPRYIVNMVGAPNYPVSRQAPQWEGSNFVAELYFEFTFPVCVLDNMKFPCFDVRLDVHVTSAAVTNTVYGYVSIGNTYASAPGNGGDPNIFGIHSGFTTSSFPTSVVDGIIIPPTSKTMAGVVTQTLDLQTGTALVNSYTFLAKAFVQVSCVVNDISDSIFIDLLQIREYPPA